MFDLPFLYDAGFGKIVCMLQGCACTISRYFYMSSWNLEANRRHGQILPSAKGAEDLQKASGYSTARVHHP